ncbi:MAG: T9SS type A sorting domain-containing protein [Dysgonamonadaceae bacterium]|jgi:beta-galactosidase/beta-glucuronidase|nr:T9SS type A sorting domain-containing protein [Dysgonamonadaceae bacterium]
MKHLSLINNKGIAGQARNDKAFVTRQSSVVSRHLSLVTCHLLLVTCYLLLVTSPVTAQEKYSLNSDNQGIVWEIKPKDDLASRTGLELSTPGFDNAGYVKGVVPGTVFTAYVEAGIVPDPNYGDNIYQVDESFYNRPFWYRAEFDLPASYEDGQRVWLHVDGINRFADFYFNGEKISGTKNSTKDVSGHMIRTKKDVTALLNKTGKNAVAVLITDAKQKKHRVEEGLAAIFGNYACPTYLSAAGWDWMPYVPGRLAGITGNVYLTFTGDAVIEDPWIRAELPNYEQAEIVIAAGIKNVAPESKNVLVSGIINPGDIRFSKTVTAPAGTTVTASFDKDEFEPLLIEHPALWYPNGYGEPNLYTCTLTCLVDGKESDTKELTFGIKKYEYQWVNNSRNIPVLTLFINGQKLFLKGGNWGISEYLLRCHGKEYETKILLHKDMNYNMIRLWTGCVTDDELYDYCDKHGIMVWDDFWYLFSIGTPDSYDDFKNNVLDKVKRLRNHPCIAVWCGANETTPVEELNTYMKNVVAEQDNNDRLYQPCSNSGGLSGSGWWMNRTPKSHFESSASNLGDGYPYGANYGYGLRTEIGTATFPTFESVKEFVPENDRWPLPTDDQLKNDDNTVWNKHFFGKEAVNAGPDTYRNTVDKQFGLSSDLEEFCEKAQLLNIEVMKGMYEAWNDKMGNDATGILVWMSNPAYPSFVWQTYDYYYDATGAYWGAKSACEPVHIQWNSSSYAIKVINATPHDLTGLTAKASIYNSAGTEIASKTAQVNALAGMPVNCFTLSKSTTNLPDIHFLKLTLTDASGKVISGNWYLKGKKEYDYTPLKDIPKASLSVSVASETENGKCVMAASISNAEDSPALAYGVRLRVVNALTGERILPIFLDDNYLFILPGETKKIQIRFDAALLKGAEPRLLIKQFLQAEESVSDIQSLEKESLPDVVIYPNPVDDVFFIDSRNTIDEVSVFNSWGCRVYRGTGHKVDMSKMQKGVYIASVKTNRQVVNKRIIKA